MKVGSLIVRGASNYQITGSITEKDVVIQSECRRMDTLEIQARPIGPMTRDK
jgi:hypothetical protein